MLLIGGFYFDSLTLLFWFYLFLKARAEILEKISLFFLVELKIPKGHFEINWPLDQIKYRKGASSRPVYYSFLDPFPLPKKSENPWVWYQPKHAPARNFTVSA